MGQDGDDPAEGPVFQRIAGTDPAVYAIAPATAAQIWFRPRTPATEDSLPADAVLARPEGGTGLAGAIVIGPNESPVSPAALPGYIAAAVLAAVSRPWDDGAKHLVWARPAADGSTPLTAFGLSARLDTLRVETPLELPFGGERRIKVLAEARLSYAAPDLVVSGPEGAGGVGIALAPASFAAGAAPSGEARVPVQGGMAGVLATRVAASFPALLEDFREGFALGFRGGDGALVRQRYPSVQWSEIADPIALPMALTVDPAQRANDLVWAGPGDSAPPPGTVTARSGFWALGVAPAPLPTAFKTRGDSVLEAVLQGDAAFPPALNRAGFATWAGSDDPAAAGTLHLSLCGLASLASRDAPGDAEVEILGGFSGTETLLASVGGGEARLFAEFVPGRPGLLAGFPYHGVSLDSPWQAPGGGAPFAPGLHGTWLRFARRAAEADPTVIHRTSPNGAPYFAAPAAPPPPPPPSQARPAEGEAAILQAFDIAHGFDGTAALFPLLAYTALAPDSGFTPGELVMAEARAVAPFRAAAIRRVGAVRGLLGAPLSAAATGTELGDGNATNPQGLVLGVDPAANGRIVDVTLGRSFANAATPEASVAPMGFTNPGPELEALFTANQVCAVVVNGAPLGAPVASLADYAEAHAADPQKALFRNAVAFASDADKQPANAWVFRLAVGGNTSLSDLRNVLVMKYCDGRLDELAANPAAWSDAETLAADPALATIDRTLVLSGVADWLQGYIADAKQRQAAGDTQYDAFVDVVTDPGWRGFLMLNAELSPEAIPTQLRGLSAGLRLDNFRAHHIGATASRVAMRSGEGEAAPFLRQEGQSSLFALVNYEHPGWRANVVAGGDPDREIPITDEGDYGFDVLQLTAVFSNGVMETFSSRIQLGINAFYGAPVSGAFEAGAGAAGRRLTDAALLLTGSYQSQDEGGSYSFGRDAPVVFALESTTLRAVTISQAQFDTLDPGLDGADIVSRFRFWGRLCFGIVSGPEGEETDLLSYGPPAGAQGYALGEGLAYSNIDLRLLSPAANPNAVRYAFEAADLSLNPGDSAPRKGSLVSDLALVPRAYVAGAPDMRPEDLDFLPVRTGQVATRQVEGTWFGIACQVDMGTPGALAGAAGFSSSLLLAVAPRTPEGLADSWAVWAGLQLPGTAPGAKLMSVQNVLKLSVAGVALNRETTATPGAAAGAEPARAFVLRLNNIGLSFMGLANLPSGATMNFFLFGEPSGSGSLGWFAAYNEDPPDPPPARLAGGRP
ncbi:hypothetical protein [Oceanicella sp. SM1341]|uniref:hypothetical protein n=1 Tax=Oceanicella sp. SM1341 TaxID=1548889 RepID=UPI000E509AAC|nr:hypothetical protein [Oceanicella sp. SM1341]